MAIPRHIAIIMDGNGRWATARGLARSEGHKAGADAVARVIESSLIHGVKYLTLYAFSTENWKRSVQEVSGLWSLLVDFLRKKHKILQEKKIALHVIGDISRLPLPARLALENEMRATAGNDALHLILALNYGGRAELLSAVRRLAEEVQNGKKRLEDLTEEDISRALQTVGIPDPDLMIRTAGEQRLSNFLLWQLSYAEFWFTERLWPDFGEEDFQQALKIFEGRRRNFGAEPEKTKI